MSSVNKAILIGRLGRDPELKYTPSGRPVANFSIATDSVWKDKTSGERQTRTEWHRIVVWGPQAETCQKYLAKGREVFIEGEIRTRKYEDKSGVERSITEIEARDVRFLGSRDGAGAGGGAGGGGRRDEPMGGDEPAAGDFGGGPADDEIPF